MSQKALRLLGLALRGSNLAVGELPVGEACQTHRARLVLHAADAAENTVRRAGREAQRAGVELVALPYTKEELGAALGRNSCAVAALTDKGLAAAVAADLAQTNGDLEPLAQALAESSRGKQTKTVGRRRTPRNAN